MTTSFNLDDILSSLPDNNTVGGNPVGACQTRGLQTSQALKKYCSLDAPYILNNQLQADTKDTVIIFVGEPISYCNGVDNLIKLKENNNILIYDIIDNFCFHHTNPLINKELIKVYQYLDVMLHPNKLYQYQLNSLLPNVEHVFMPHQWDFRNEDVIVYENVNTNKAAYIGGVAGGFQLDISKVKDYVEKDKKRFLEQNSELTEQEFDTYMENLIDNIEETRELENMNQQDRNF